MNSQINDLRSRLGSAAAATAITGLMLVSVGLGFPRLAGAAEPAATAPAIKTPATETAVKSRALIERASRALLARETGEHISELWVFPTADANAVFVYYTTANHALRTSVKAGAGGTRHLALIEMKGEQIAHLQDFSAPVQTLSAGASVNTMESGS